MTVYVDTSALAKLLLIEPGSDLMRRTVEANEPFVASSLGYVELRATIAAARRNGRMPADAHNDAVGVDSLWAIVNEIQPTPELLRNAAELSERMALRAYDAVHLASLIRLPSATVTLACWGNDLRNAAQQLGYDLLPEA